MIKFFRRIRKHLLNQNKVGKYLLYAIGEIALVMVGILLALQVNNWNEKGKLTRHELKMLDELYSTILVDIKFQKLQIDTNKSSVYSAEIISRSINKRLPYFDSLSYHFSNFITRSKSFVADNAYQNAKKYGLDFIINDSLQQELIWTYERNANYLEELNERDNLYEYNIAVPLLTELFDRVDFSEDLSRFNSIINFSQPSFSLKPKSENIYPIDYKALMKNNKFQNVVKTTISRREKLIMFQEIRLMRMNRLIKLLEMEISSR